MPSSLRASARPLAAAALAAAPPARAAGSYTFRHTLSGDWSDNLTILGSVVLTNWEGNVLPATAYDTDIHIGTSTIRTALASNVDYDSLRLRSPALDTTSGVTLTGGLLNVAGGGSISATSGTHSIANAIALDANGAAVGVAFSVASGGTLTSTGAISGVGTLVKTGAGTLVLSGANAYTNGTTISAGTLVAGAANIPFTRGAPGFGPDGRPPSSAVTVARDATLSLTSIGGSGTPRSYDQTVSSLSGAGTVHLGEAVLTLGGGSFSGQIDGDGALVKTGAGTLTLSGENTYTMGTTVLGGTLAVSGTDALPTTGAISLEKAGTLALYADATIGALSGTGTVPLSSRALSFGNSESESTFSGVITGNGATLGLPGNVGFRVLGKVGGGTRRPLASGPVGIQGPDPARRGDARHPDGGGQRQLRRHRRHPGDLGEGNGHPDLQASRYARLHEIGRRHAERREPGLRRLDHR